MSNFLLTGAGFSKNFGGLLASELWDALFNHRAVQATPSIREKLLSDQDFESVYHDLISRGSEDERRLISEAMSAAYKEIDNALMDFSFVPGSPYPVNIYRVQDLIASFSGPIHDPGYIFTLNQDLFIERHYYNGPRPVLPGVRQSPEWFSSVFCSREQLWNSVQIIDSPDLDGIKSSYKRHHQLVYVKLHGSCNWRTTNSKDLMVIGRDKENQIERNYLLNWYFEIFRDALATQEARLLVIGYGFGDPHINRAISTAVSAAGLSLYILDPTPTAELLPRIRKLPEGNEIIAGIKAHFPYTLREIFPANQENTGQWRQIQDRFFERVKMNQAGAS